MKFARLLRIAFCRAAYCRPLTGVYDRVDSLFYGPTKLGALGERAAERHLLRQGWIIVDRGYSGRGGEIDLIAIDGQTVVFVEVKTRSSDRKGHPAEAVDDTKQRHLTQTAYGYLKKKKLFDCSFRFDVIAVIWPDVTQAPEIEHFENAFEPVGRFQLV